MTPAERLVAAIRARDALGPVGIVLPDGVTARRTYAGYWQRSRGAWVWRLHAPDGSAFLRDRYDRLRSVGSVWRMGDLLAASEWIVDEHRGDVHIGPA